MVIVVTPQCVDGGGIQIETENLICKLRRDDFIAINRKYPVVRGFIDGNVLEWAEPDKRVLVDGHIFKPRSNCYGIIRRPVVNNHHLRERFKRTEALSKMNGGVFG